MVYCTARTDFPTFHATCDRDGKIDSPPSLAQSARASATIFSSEERSESQTADMTFTDITKRSYPVVEKERCNRSLCHPVSVGRPRGGGREVLIPQPHPHLGGQRHRSNIHALLSNPSQIYLAALLSGATIAEVKAWQGSAGQGEAGRGKARNPSGYSVGGIDCS